MPKIIRKTNTARYMKGIKTSGRKTAENLFALEGNTLHHEKRKLKSTLSIRRDVSKKGGYQELPRQELKYNLEQLEEMTKIKEKLKRGRKKILELKPNLIESENQRALIEQTIAEGQKNIENFKELQRILQNQLSVFDQVESINGLNQETTYALEIMRKTTIKKLGRVKQKIKGLRKWESLE